MSKRLTIEEFIETLKGSGSGGSSGGGGPVKLSITHTVQDVNGTSYDFFYLNYTWRELKNFLDDGRVFIYESSDGSSTEQLPVTVGSSITPLDSGSHLCNVTLVELFADTPMRYDLASINARMETLFQGSVAFTCEDEDSRPSVSAPV